MTNWQVLLTAFGMVLTLVGAIWGITERNTTRLVEQIDKRLSDRDEKLMAKLDTLRAELKSEAGTIRAEMKGELGILRSDINHLSDRVGQLERRLFAVSTPHSGD